MNVHEDWSDNSDFEEWLEEVIDELSQLTPMKPLTEEQRDWLYDVWDNFRLSPAEAAFSFMNENV